MCCVPYRGLDLRNVHTLHMLSQEQARGDDALRKKDAVTYRIFQVRCSVGV